MNRAVLAAIDRWIGRYARPKIVPVGAPCVVVTGGSSGLGLSIACVFVSQGETVVLIGRDRKRLANAKASFAPHVTARVFTFALDVTGECAAPQLTAWLDARSFYLDILVNCAGIGLAGRFDSHSVEAIDKLIALNITAVTRLISLALPDMKARGRGGILNVASLGGYVPGPHQAAYYASKAYVCSLTEALASEVSGLGVRLTVVAPGPIATLFHSAMGADDALYRRLIPALSPERAARSAVAYYRAGRSVVVPGLIPKLLAVLITILPHWVTLPVLALLLRPVEEGCCRCNKS